MYTWVAIFKQYGFFVHLTENISNTLECLAAFIDGGQISLSGDSVVTLSD